MVFPASVIRRIQASVMKEYGANVNGQLPTTLGPRVADSAIEKYG